MYGDKWLVAISDGEIAHARRCDGLRLECPASVKDGAAVGKLAEVERVICLMVGLDDDRANLAALLRRERLIAQRRQFFFAEERVFSEDPDIARSQRLLQQFRAGKGDLAH